MVENQDYKIGMSLLNDLAKQVDSLGWVALSLDMIVGKSPILSTEEHAEITEKVERLITDCEIIENKIGEDQEAMALVNLAKGRLYAVYIPAKGFPIPHFKDYKGQSISCLKNAIELTSSEKTKGFARYYLGRIYNVWGDKKEAIENLEQAVNLLTVDDPIGMEAAKELERLKTEKKGMCFIATTIYGSPYHYNVLMLKEFRDFYLSKNSWGRALIKGYYKKSPFVANILSKNSFMKGVIKLLILTPIIKILTFINKIENKK